MKKVIWISVFLLVFGCGFATASSINGDYKGNPIVKIIVNGTELHPGVPGQVIDGSTLLPARAISEALGAQVQWDPNTYTATITNKKKLSYDEILKLAENVFMLKGFQTATTGIQGSSFVVNGGYLISAHHVIEGANRIEVAGNSFFKPDFDNPRTDVFGIKVSNLPALSYITGLPDVGSKVYAVGFPNGKFTITEGYVLSTDYVGGYPTISHSAFTDHGNSGGPLLNEYGEVIGVNSSSNPGNTIHYSIPMTYYQQEIDKLQK